MGVIGMTYIIIIKIGNFFVIISQNMKILYLIPYNLFIWLDEYT